MKLNFFGLFLSHCNQRDLLRWHAGSGGKLRTCVVHGEVAGAQGQCRALPQRGVQADVARSGRRLDLALVA